jgi:hypothetical protein
MANFDGNYRLLGTIDIAALKAKVMAQTEADWDASTWRQERFQVHKFTQTLELVFDRDLPKDQPTKHEKYFSLGCETLLAPLIEQIAMRYSEPGFLIRAVIVRLSSKGTINRHVDIGPMFTNAHRIHVPIETNDKALFMVGDETLIMKQGEMWEINNLREHYVDNGGDEGRIHLIMDWAPLDITQRITAFCAPEKQPQE